MNFIPIQPRGLRNSIDYEYLLHAIQADYYVIQGKNVIHRTRRICTGARRTLKGVTQIPGREMTFYVAPVRDPMELRGFKLCKQCDCLLEHSLVVETEMIARSIEVPSDLVEFFDRSQSTKFFVNRFYRVISAFFQSRNGKIWGDDLMVQDVASGKYKTIFWQEVKSVEGYDKERMIYSRKLK